MIAVPTPTLTPRRLACARCGAVFDCGSGGRDGGCWCMDETSRAPMPATDGEDCLCPGCLRVMISDKAGGTSQAR